MSSAARFVTRLYALLLRLYPRRFRAEFGEEMQAVFAAVAAEAAAHGSTAVVLVCWRELRDTLGAIIRAHFDRLKPAASAGRRWRATRLSPKGAQSEPLPALPGRPGWTRRVAVGQYAALLRLRPRHSRAEFGDEMAYMFGAALGETAWRGRWAAVAQCASTNYATRQ